jgi:hypothetical protein
VFSYLTALPAAAMAGFFEDLLPRLEDFESSQWWPQDPISQATASLHAPPPLPRLRVLTLFGDQAPWAGFMGARPLKLSTTAAIIERWLSHAVDDGTTAVCPLACVRTLEIFAGSASEFTPMNVARILRASPNLETLTVYADKEVDASWLAASAHPALGELVHSNLRRIRCCGQIFCSYSVLRSDFRRLRRRPHFPRLKAINFTLEEESFFVTPLESPSLVRRLFDRFMEFVATAQCGGFFSSRVTANVIIKSGIEEVTLCR